MLTKDERDEILAELQHYPDKQAVVPEALKIVQRHRRWVSDEAVQDIAELLDMSAEQIDSIATFYNLIFRQPVGRHVILLCDSVSCWIMGYQNMLDCLSSRLGIGFGETTPDGRFTLLPMVCLGACDHAPAMMVDHDLHGDLTVEKIEEILATYV
ncbi:MAG TPA: NADH-quinone oxidoreductase subunit NuoE [Armatimonadota bacterium]|jgi:NADH-quinone oxidoreductase subunit E